MQGSMSGMTTILLCQNAGNLKLDAPLSIMAEGTGTGTGETGPISVSLPINMTIAGLFAIACYNCVEILISLLSRFKRHDGLYFWSMVVATLGIVLHSIVVLLRYYSLGPNFLLCVFTCVGWYGMDKSKTRWVLWMIIINFFVLHVPTTILFLGSNTKDSSRYIGPFNTIISGLYIWETSRGLKPIFAVKKVMDRKMIRYLIIVNVLVILLDISLIATQFMSHFTIAMTYKPVVYSIKLKIEFVVLNKLVMLVQHSDLNCMHIVGGPERSVREPSYLECQSLGRNSSMRTGSDIPIQMHYVEQVHTNVSAQSGAHAKAKPLNFLDLTPYCKYPALLFTRTCWDADRSKDALSRPKDIIHNNNASPAQVELNSTATRTRLTAITSLPVPKPPPEIFQPDQ
ncbi:RecQ helicase TLH3 [Fusarium oxysporum f. sp. albedinis]|nr:RecQ helicase TLH3 [Fusarium oxysporum f. sp. albedinis]